MSILTAENLSLSYGAFDVFRSITATVANDSKIGLVGPNGIGKTSLLLILAGILPATSGKVHLARGRRIGYLRQEAVEAFGDRTSTVYTEMLSAFADLQASQEKLYEMEAAMSAGEYSEELLGEYGTLQQDFEHRGGYDYDLRIQQTLEGLGLGKKFWHTPINHLSGGQKTRALLARLLLEKPDLLMLDEPTNHLDIDATEWLERTLREWNGAVLAVSHDRFFMDNTVNTIWEMNRTGIEIFRGNYSAYLLQREERWEYLEKAFNEEKARLLHEIDFIQKNWVRASTHARALGLLRRLSREIAIVENFGILALRDGTKWSETGLSVERHLDVVQAVRAVNAIQLPNGRPPRIRPRLPSGQASGNVILRGDNLVVGYPGHRLFSVKTLELRRGECAALIGPNGSGKTTFLKALLGQVRPLDGSLRLGAGLKIGYFAQAHDSLRSDRSVLDELLSHKAMEPGAARNHLAKYLFTGEDVFKPVSALSGGERARLAFAILGLDGSNFLLLDEPTNHLDVPAREALQEILENYNGTILLVTHDRYLIDRLATQIWDLRGGKLNAHHGGYRDFVLRSVRRPVSKDSTQSTRAKPTLLLAPRPMVRDNSRETRRREEALVLVEKRIRDQEARIQKLTAELQKNGGSQSYERTHDLSNQVARAQAALEDLISEWERLAA